MDAVAVTQEDNGADEEEPKATEIKSGVVIDGEKADTGADTEAEKADTGADDTEAEKAGGGAPGSGGGTDDPKCYNCGKAGHKSRACPEPRNPAAAGRRDREEGRGDKADRAVRTGPPPDLPGSTVAEDGRKRRCDKCRKVFGAFDRMSFEQHACGRAAAKPEKEKRKRDDGDDGAASDQEEGEGGEDAGRGERDAKRRGDRKPKAVAERGAAPEVAGSTVVDAPDKGGTRLSRRCDKCAKSFSPFDLESFKSHVCGRPAGSGKAGKRAEARPRPRDGPALRWDGRDAPMLRRDGRNDHRQFDDRRRGNDDRRGYDDRRGGGGYDDRRRESPPRRDRYDDRRGGYEYRRYDGRREDYRSGGYRYDDRRGGYDDRRPSPVQRRSRSPLPRSTSGAATGGGAKQGSRKDQRRSRSADSLGSLLS
jgi:hypothetical protein